ncbi:MAG: phosphopantetheine-binding protein [Deferribacteraceae bacterium]|jgi:acyl carrier protein|nr:phosphopantetheine-binding protein [Deferribacteraceae bacterium]
MTRDDLEREIKHLIITSLDLEDVAIEDIKSEEPLFVEGLGLDSIDALELGMALKKKYQLNFKTTGEENKAYFRSVSTLADMIIQDGQLAIN